MRDLPPFNKVAHACLFDRALDGQQDERSMIVEAAHESDIEEIAALGKFRLSRRILADGMDNEADLLSGQRVDAAGLRADLSLKPAAMVLTMRASAGKEILACVWLDKPARIISISACWPFAPRYRPAASAGRFSKKPRAWRKRPARGRCS